MMKKLFKFALLGLMAAMLVSGCIITSSNECDGVNCDGHGTCHDVGLLASCTCDDGYVNDGLLHCVADPCDGENCDGHGTCYDDGMGVAACICDNGYINDGDFSCVMDATGSGIEFEWSFAPGTRSCGDAYVASVNIFLHDGVEDVIDQNVDCALIPGVALEQLEDGTYTLTVEGVSSNGTVYYSHSEQVVLSGQNIDLGLIALEPVDLADITFTWAFGAAGETDCMVYNVDTIEVTVYDLQQTEPPEFNANTGCDSAGASLTDFDLGTWNLVLQGICPDQSIGYELDVNVDIAHPFDDDFGEIVLDDVGGC